MSALALTCLLGASVGLGQTSMTEVYPEVLITWKPKDAIAWRKKLPPVKPVDIVSLPKASDLEELPALRIRFPKEKVDVLIDRACFASDQLFLELLFRESVVEFFKSNGFQSAVIDGQTGSKLFKRTYKLMTSTISAGAYQEEGHPSGEFMLCPSITGFLVVNGEEKRIDAHLPFPNDMGRFQLNPSFDLAPDSIPKREFQVTNLIASSRSVQALGLAGEAWRLLHKRLADLSESPHLYGGPRPEKQKPVPFSSLPEWKQKALLNYRPYVEIGQMVDQEEVRKIIRNSLFRQSFVGVEVMMTSPSPNGSMGGGSRIVLLSRRG